VQELEKIKILIALLTFNLAVSFPFSIFSSIITAHENFIFAKLVNICRVVINPLIMIPLLLLGYKSIALVVVITVLNITTLLINFYFCKTKIGIAPKFGFFNKKLFKEILGYSFFIFLTAIVDQIYWNSGQFILGSVAGTVMVAIFAVAITLKNLYFSFSTAIVGVLLPKVTKMITENVSTQQLSEIFIRVGRLQFLILSFILTGFILFGKTFVELWAGKNYSDSYLMALCIMVPVTIPLIQNLGITILQAKNQQKFRSVVYVMIAIVNVMVSIPLAKEIGGLGCAMVTGCSLFVGNGIIMNIYYYKKIKLDILGFWKEIIKMTIPILIPVGIYLSYKHLINVQFSVFNYILNICLFSILFLVSMWSLGINNYEKNIFRSLLKIKKI
jgi:O-antigen/teichoic acid export membrane protein